MIRLNKGPPISQRLPHPRPVIELLGDGFQVDVQVVS